MSEFDIKLHTKEVGSYESDDDGGKRSSNLERNKISERVIWETGTKNPQAKCRR